MKRKFEIYREAVSEFSPNGGIVREIIKTFKNEPEAIAFFNDPRNQRRYGPYYMSKRDADGHEHVWDDRYGRWLTIKYTHEENRENANADT